MQKNTTRQHKVSRHSAQYWHLALNNHYRRKLQYDKSRLHVTYMYIIARVYYHKSKKQKTLTKIIDAEN